LQFESVDCFRGNFSQSSLSPDRSLARPVLPRAFSVTSSSLLQHFPRRIPPCDHPLEVFRPCRNVRRLFCRSASFFLSCRYATRVRGPLFSLLPLAPGVFWDGVVPNTRPRRDVLLTPKTPNTPRIPSETPNLKATSPHTPFPFFKELSWVLFGSFLLRVCIGRLQRVLMSPGLSSFPLAFFIQ